MLWIVVSSLFSCVWTGLVKWGWKKLKYLVLFCLSVIHLVYDLRKWNWWKLLKLCSMLLVIFKGKLCSSWWLVMGLVSFKSAKTSYILWYLLDGFVLTKVVLFFNVGWCLFGLFGYLSRFGNWLVWSASSVYCINVCKFYVLSCCHDQLNLGSNESICLAWFVSIVLSCFVWFHMTIVGIALTVL